MADLHVLGDQAVLAYLPDERQAGLLAAAARAAAHAGWLDVVQAYSSVAVHFDPDRTTVPIVMGQLAALSTAAVTVAAPKYHEIPCCYEIGKDLAHVAAVTGMSPADVVRLHSSVEYTVYAIGFCPGFGFLGYLPPQLSGVPRRPSPRLCVEPGSVGMTGRQTGVYPLPRPGGWNLIGRTPLTLVDVADNFFPLAVGDRVQFRAIDGAEFERRQGERLPATPTSD